MIKIDRILVEVSHNICSERVERNVFEGKSAAMKYAYDMANVNDFSSVAMYSIDDCWHKVLLPWSPCVKSMTLEERADIVAEYALNFAESLEDLGDIANMGAMNYKEFCAIYDSFDSIGLTKKLPA